MQPWQKALEDRVKRGPTYLPSRNIIKTVLIVRHLLGPAGTGLSLAAPRPMVNCNHKDATPNGPHNKAGR